MNIRDKAREHANKVALPEIRSMYPTISRTEMADHLITAYLAGAAEQQERDAKLMEEKFHKVSRRPYYDTSGPDDMYSPFAEVIRDQDKE